jgi:hypothetical protein
MHDPAVLGISNREPTRSRHLARDVEDSQVVHSLPQVGRHDVWVGRTRRRIPQLSCVRPPAKSRRLLQDSRPEVPGGSSQQGIQTKHVP